MRWRQWADETVAEATGQEHRHDPVLPGTGGPAGNALLTAWTGLLLLGLFLIELATLLNLGAWLNWHVVVGVLLVPPALLKITTTAWRIVGYYTNRAPYRLAGPPPLPLRLLGPLVMLFTLAVLSSGLILIWLGPQASHTAYLTLRGFQVDAVTLHQAAFIAWAAATGLHTLGRLVPAPRIVGASGRADPRVPGEVLRATVFIATLLIAGIAAALLLQMAGPWLAGGPESR